MKYKIIFILLITIFIIGCNSDQPIIHENNNVEFVNLATANQNVNLSEEKAEFSNEATEVIKIKDVFLKVPFTSQAPFGEWDDQRFQDGCEEAAVLMVVKWLNGNGLSKQEAKQEIIDLAAWQIDNYGSYVDTSAQDTAKRLLEEYYGVIDYIVKENITVEDIKKALSQGYLVITPMDGQTLANPNYTAPGPERHMLVIIGYDMNNKEFITNDAGTRMGEGYRYSEQHLFNSIRDYPTGDHKPITQIEKVMIVIR